MTAATKVRVGDEWLCLCGNTAQQDGFYPCDERGAEVEPTIGQWKTDLYRCAKCSRVFDMNTGLIKL